MIAQEEREGKPGCPLRDGGPRLGRRLSPGLELDVLDGDAVDRQLEVVAGAHDGGVEAVGRRAGCGRSGKALAMVVEAPQAVVADILQHLLPGQEVDLELVENLLPTRGEELKGTAGLLDVCEIL